MVIKPHHFMDIIKLYGGGIQVFVPDTAMIFTGQQMRL